MFVWIFSEIPCCRTKHRNFPALTSAFCVSCVWLFLFYDPSSSMLLSWSWTFRGGGAWTEWNVIVWTNAISDLINVSEMFSLKKTIGTVQDPKQKYIVTRYLSTFKISCTSKSSFNAQYFLLLLGEHYFSMQQCSNFSRLELLPSCNPLILEAHTATLLGTFLTFLSALVMLWHVRVLPNNYLACREEL